MGPNARVEVTTQVRSADVPKDLIVNTMHFQSGTSSPLISDYQELADKVKSVWTTASGFGGLYPWTRCAHRGVTVNVYDLTDPKPRPERGHSSYTPLSWETTALGPREVALCLSFYSDRNLKSQRGRIYLGPFLNSEMTEVPGDGVTGTLIDLAKGIDTMTTVANWRLEVYSPTHLQHHVVTNYWVNNVWDEVNGRDTKETIRLRYP